MHDLPLDCLLRPSSIALVGASGREHAAGNRILRNLLTAPFPGPVYPVNPRYRVLQGLTCYPSLQDLPQVPDAAFIALPAENAVETLEDAGRLGVRAALMNATGFADAGATGIALQNRLVAIARRYGMAVCGPNNSGFINLWDRIYPSTYYAMPRAAPGPVAVIAQSGSIGIALSQDDRQLGLGYIITAGNEAVCGIADYLDYVARDPRIRVVMMFVETIREPARFARAARAAAQLGKRVVAVKVGRTEAGLAAVAAHSGALAGDDATCSAFFRHHGIVRASDLDEMIETAALFSACPTPPSGGLVVVTISGGEAGLIADLGLSHGIRLPALAEATQDQLRPLLSPYQAARNPLDVMGLGWSRERIGAIIRTLLDDRAIGTVAFAADASGAGIGDAALVQDMADICAAETRGADKQIVFFTNTAAGGPNPQVQATLDRVGIPILCGMQPAVAALGHWSQYREPVPEPEPGVAAATLRSLAMTALQGDEPARFQAMTLAGVPMAASVAVGSADDAVAVAQQVGLPVVLKGTSPHLMHKSELGLVRVGLTTMDAVREAFAVVQGNLRRSGAAHDGTIVVQPMISDGIELIVGIRNQSGYGSVVVAGIGGTLVELIGEAAIRIGPVGIDAAADMLRETRAMKLLQGFRGKGPYDIQAATQAIAALSQLGWAAQGAIAAIEINPLIVRPSGLGAVGVDVLIEPAPDVQE